MQAQSRGQQPQTQGQQPQTQGQQSQMQGQQPQMQTQSQGQQSMPRGPSFEDHVTDELRIALEDFSELSHVAAWCATTCASGGPELGTCARICQDVAEIAALNEMLIARDSMFGPEVADTFCRIAAEALPELRRYDQHAHVSETIATLERTANSCESLLSQVSGASSEHGLWEQPG